MLKQLAAAASLLLLISCNNETASDSKPADTTVNTPKPMDGLTDAERSEGWESLFDGSSLKGWHKYGGAPVGKAWKASDSSIMLDATNKADWQIADGGDIITDGEYENFHLKLDWKIDTGGNSGIIFYINEDTVKYQYPWMTGPEMQVLDNERHADAKIFKHRAGDLYDLIPSSKETVTPALGWNHAEIRSLNGKLDLYLNGTNVVSTTMWDDGWKKLIAGSKFKAMKDFGTYKKGRIGLQDHGNNVWFKNIRIKRL